LISFSRKYIDVAIKADIKKFKILLYSSSKNKNKNIKQKIKDFKISFLSNSAVYNSMEKSIIAGIK